MVPLPRSYCGSIISPALPCQAESNVTKADLKSTTTFYALYTTPVHPETEPNPNDITNPHYRCFVRFTRMVLLQVTPGRSYLQLPRQVTGLGQGDSEFVAAPNNGSRVKSAIAHR